MSDVRRRSSRSRSPHGSEDGGNRRSRLRTRSRSPPEERSGSRRRDSRRRGESGSGGGSRRGRRESTSSRRRGSSSSRRRGGDGNNGSISPQPLLQKTLLKTSRWADDDDDSSGSGRKRDGKKKKKKKKRKDKKKDKKKRKRGSASATDATAMDAAPTSGFDGADGVHLLQPVRGPQGHVSSWTDVEPFLGACDSVEKYEYLNKIDEGTYGIVYRAKDKATGEIVAIKRVKILDEHEEEGFPLSAIREANLLLKLDHPHIVQVKEVVVGETVDAIFMVMEYIDHELKHLMEENEYSFSMSEIKTVMLQLLQAVVYMHDNWILHRDLKTSNLLYHNSGSLKVADFGMAREYSSPARPMTQLVVTQWYRAPEILMGQSSYTAAVDMWSVGCIMGELLDSGNALLPGTSEIDQLNRIFKLVGTPNDESWPGFRLLPNAGRMAFVQQDYSNLRRKFPGTVLTNAGAELLEGLLTCDPAQRLTAHQALDHAWFKEKPLPKDPELLPTFPSGHEKEKIHSAAEAPSLFHRPKSDAYSLIGSARTGGFTLKY